MSVDVPSVLWAVLSWGEGRLRSPAGNQNTWDGKAKGGTRCPGHMGTPQRGWACWKVLQVLAPLLTIQARPRRLAMALLPPAQAVGVGGAASPPLSLQEMCRAAKPGLPSAQPGWVAQHPPTTARSNPAGPLGWVLGGSYHLPCPLCWWQCPGAEQRRGRTSLCGQGWRTPVVLEPLASARHPVQGQPGTGDSHLFISTAGFESRQSGHPSVPPAAVEPNRMRWLRRAPLPWPLVCVGTGCRTKPV